MKISQPSSVIPIECSNCADRLRSRVTAVQPSSSNLHRRLADIDHRLDGEEHAGPQLRAGAGPADMDHLGRGMEIAAEAVAAEIADHAVAVALGKALDGMADVAEMVARLRLGDAAHHRFIGHLDQPPRLHRHVADQDTCGWCRRASRRGSGSRRC